MSEQENQTTENDAGLEQIRRHNRAQMIVIMSIAFITLGGSYLAFYFAQSSGGWGTTNNGAFVEPALSTDQLGWQVEGERRRWWIWVVSPDCSEQCQVTVKNMQALHILLNREADRVRRGFTGTTLSGESWLQQFPRLARISTQTLNGTKPGIYIADPNGNLVFHYEMDVNPKLVLQDLKKLLKVSHIG